MNRSLGLTPLGYSLGIAIIAGVASASPIPIGKLARELREMKGAPRDVSSAAPAASKAPGSLSDRLTAIRTRVLSLEQGLIDGLRSAEQARSNVKRIGALIELQREERELSRKRIGELEQTVGDLEVRRGQLNEKIQVQETSIRRSLVALDRARAEVQPAPLSPEAERFESPRRRLLRNLIERGLKEIEAYRIDLADASQLEERINEEKQQLAYLFHDLKEQESVLELNRQLQTDLARKKHLERVAQLENYRKLKTSEQQVSKMIGEFNSRIELERANEAERVVSKAMIQGDFGRLKGHLPLPVEEGRVVAGFGRAFDEKSRLFIFKKGIDVATAAAKPVKAVAAGKIVYSGELPEYGRVTIIDHGEHFYSLSARLGDLSKKIGESVVAGDVIGSTDDQGTPLYFEIRARNVAINPLHWVTARN